MGKYSLYPAILTVLFSSICGSLLTKCHRGSYYLPLNDGQFVCPLCRPGTFMPDHDHTNTDCRECMKVEDDRLEILITPCNGTHDAVIHCVSGYYRMLPRNSREKERCEQCGECGIFHEILPCRIYEDIHCCADENFEVLPDTNGVPGCVERQWFCKKGEYFNTQSYQCFSCPKDTFMPTGYHSMTECFNCHGSSPEHLPKHGLIIHPCNKTHQAVVGCEDGFYINQTMGPQIKDIGCSPCKTCSSAHGQYKGRECGCDQDTVCCSRPDMMVVDTPGGPECRLFTNAPRPLKLNMKNTSDTQNYYEDQPEIEGQQHPVSPVLASLPNASQPHPELANYEYPIGHIIGAGTLMFVMGGAVVAVLCCCFPFIKRIKCCGRKNCNQSEDVMERDEGKELTELLQQQQQQQQAQKQPKQK